MISTYEKRSEIEATILPLQIEILEKCLMRKIVKTTKEVDRELKADLQDINGKRLIGCRTRDISYFYRYGDITFRKSEIDMMLSNKSIISYYMFCWNENDKIVKFILLSGNIVKDIVKEKINDKKAIKNTEGNQTSFYNFSIETLKEAIIDSNI